jgi:hypothetical protein
MSQELAIVDNETRLLEAFAGGQNPFLVVTENEGVSDGAFGRFNGNTGQYIIDNNEMDAGFDAVIEMIHAKQAWLGFDSDNRPIRGPEVSIVSGKALPDPEDKPDVRWNKQIVVPIVLMDGRRIVYSSKGEKPTRPMWKLIRQFGGLMGRHRLPDGRFKLPVVSMGSRGFEMMVEENGKKVKVRKYGEDLKIVDWMTPDDVKNLVTAPVEDESAEPAMKTINGDVTDVEVEIITPAQQAAAAQAAAATQKAAGPSAAASRFRR